MAEKTENTQPTGNRSTNMKDKEGNTALHIAVKSGHVDVLETLLKLGVRIDEKNNKGETGLFIAVSLQMEEAVRCLVKNGGDIWAEDEEGTSVWHVAAYSGNSVILDILANRLLESNRETAGEKSEEGIPRYVEKTEDMDKSSGGKMNKSINDERSSKNVYKEDCKSFKGKEDKTEEDGPILLNAEFVQKCNSQEDFNKSDTPASSECQNEQKDTNSQEDLNKSDTSASSECQKVQKDNHSKEDLKKSDTSASSECQKVQKDNHNALDTLSEGCNVFQSEDLRKSPNNVSEISATNNKGRRRKRNKTKAKREVTKETQHQTDKACKEESLPSLYSKGHHSFKEDSKSSTQDVGGLKEDICPIVSNVESASNAKKFRNPEVVGKREVTKEKQRQTECKGVNKNRSSAREPSLSTDDSDSDEMFHEGPWTSDDFSDEMEKIVLKKFLNENRGKKFSDIKIRDKRESTALHVAARCGSIRTIKRFLNDGVYVDVLDKYKATPLIRAAENCRLKAIRVLHKAGADLNKREITGCTALHGAAIFNKLPAVNLLLSLGINIHIEDIGGDTALHYAVMRSYLSVVAALLNAGADPYKKNKGGQSPAAIAYSFSDKPILALISKYKPVPKF